MRFLESEINLAIQLRGIGLAWEPHAGHFVFDIDGLVRAGSPFQAGVYVINSTNEYETIAGGPSKLQERFVWLPTWEDARAWLEDRGVSAGAVFRAWNESQNAGATDRQVLYGLMLDLLKSENECRA